MTDVTKTEPLPDDKQPEPGLIGRAIGDFRVLRLLGRGGMGEVYLAEQVSLHRHVALKVLRQDLVADANYLRRFEAEAKAVAPISHPNIVSVISIGHDQGVHYIALEYVQGMNLREYLSKKGPMEANVFLSVSRKVAAALQRAYEHGIIHRDIKPENVLLTKKGEVKVADFGLARQITAERVEITQTGVTMGTPLYMSPEQIEGKALDHRTDLYSFGIMCYHMLAGHPPFRGETAMAVAIQHVRGNATPLSELRPDLPRELLDIVAKLMAKEPSDRYQTPKEVLRDLNRLRDLLHEPSDSSLAVDDLVVDAAPSTVTASRPTPAKTLTRLTSTLRHPRNRPWVVAGSLVVCLLLGGGVAWSRREPVVRSQRERDSLRPVTSNIEKQGSAWWQLRHATSVLPSSELEAGLWAVIDYYPGSVPETLEALQELMSLYLPRRDYERALLLAEEMIGRDNETQQQFGYLLKGIVESRQGKAQESNESFLECFSKTSTRRIPSLPTRQLDWLGRQYFMALTTNFEILGRPRDPEMATKFWETFRADRRP